MIIDKDEEPDDNIDSPEFRKKVERARKEPRKKATRNLNPEKKPQSPRFMIVIHMLSQTLKTELEANASCALSQAPFMRSDRTPYLEIHHIIFLSEGGTDILENVAALCPNCHRECHSGASAFKLRSELLEKFSETHTAKT